MRRYLKMAIGGCLLAGAALALSACGSSGSSGTGSSSAGSGGRVVDIYSSLPMHGPPSTETVALVNGIRLALAQNDGKAGGWAIQYTPLDDSTARMDKWDPIATAANARRAASDPNAVYYIGESDSAATAVSIPILNEAGIAQVSLAYADPPAYNPNGSGTYLRIVPRNSIQAASDLLAMKQAGCTRVAVASDDEPYGAGLADLIEREKHLYGVDVVSSVRIDPRAPDFRSYAALIRAQGANCFLFSGLVFNGGVQITKDVNAALPKARIFGPDGMCTSSWTNSRAGGVPASIDRLIECTGATMDVSGDPGGRSFLAAYDARYGTSTPDPAAVYGYEAMKLGLDTIAGLGVDGNSKAAVLKALFAITARQSVLGTYGFDKNGYTTLRSFGLYKVAADGDPTFFKTLTPARISS